MWNILRKGSDEKEKTRENEAGELICSCWATSHEEYII
jgi:hypothetical protein